MSPLHLMIDQHSAYNSYHTMSTRCKAIPVGPCIESFPRKATFGHPSLYQTPPTNCGQILTVTTTPKSSILRNACFITSYHPIPKFREDSSRSCYLVAISHSSYPLVAVLCTVAHRHLKSLKIKPSCCNAALRFFFIRED